MTRRYFSWEGRCCESDDQELFNFYLAIEGGSVALETLIAQLPCIQRIEALYSDIVDNRVISRVTVIIDEHDKPAMLTKLRELKFNAC